MANDRLMYLLTRHIFTIYAIVGLVFGMIVRCFKIEYDSGGLMGWVYWIGQAFCLLFWIFSESLFLLNKGEAVPFHTVITIICGLATAYCLDRWLLYKRK